MDHGASLHDVGTPGGGSIGSAPTGHVAATAQDVAATASGPAAQTSRRCSGRRVLVAYFSHPGENYYYGDRTHLDVG